MKTGKPDPEQHKSFVETARALECDEDEAAFDEKLRRIATARPKHKSNRPKREKPHNR